MKRLISILLSIVMVMTMIPTLALSTFAATIVEETDKYTLDSDGLLTIKDGVTEIGSDIFEYRESIVSVAIPRSVTYISSDAFDGCLTIENIYYHGNESEWKEIYSGNLENVVYDYHSFSKIEEVDPTCTENGVLSYWKCDDCGLCSTSNEVIDEITDVDAWKETDAQIPSAGHNYDAEVIKPTYTAKGYTLYTCSECGDTYKGDKTAMKKLSKPSVTVKNDYTTAKVSWKKVSGATKYYVYQATSKSGKYKKVATTTSTSASFKKLKLGKTYYYKVKAYNSKQTSDYSKVKSVKILPNAPTMSAKVTSTSKTITVSWGKVSKASGYYVYRKKGDGSWKKIATIKKNSTVKYKDSNVSGVYSYAVVSYKKVDGKTYKSAKSTAIKTRTLKAKTTLKFKQYNDEFKTKVSWKEISGANEYELSYKAGESGSWKSAGTTKSLSMINKQTHGKYYYYRVRPIYNVNGVKTYGPYYEKEEGFIIYYEPSFSVINVDETYSSTDVILMYISNTGSGKMRVYAKDALLLDNDYYDYDRTLTLIDFEDARYGKSTKVKYVDIPAHSSAYVAFAVDGNDTWYDAKTKVLFRFRYDGIYYVCGTSSYYGTVYELDT